MVLRRADFAAFVANWTDKATNLRGDRARRSNIGLDALVFVDDNPVERERRCARELPEVAVPELPADPALYVRAAPRRATSRRRPSPPTTGRAPASTRRTCEREGLAAPPADMDGFLAELAMTVEVGAGDGPQPRPRHPAHQQDQPVQHHDAPPHRGRGRRRWPPTRAALTLQFRLLDKFGDNGIVSVALLEPAGDGHAGARQLGDELPGLRPPARGRGPQPPRRGRPRPGGRETLRAAFLPTAENGVIADLSRGSASSGRDCRRTALPVAPPLAGHVARPTRISPPGAAA